MTKQKKRVVFSILTTLTLCITLLVGSALFGTNTEKTKSEQEYSVKLTAGETVDIVTAEGSDYVIIFSSDSRPTDQTLASDLSSAIRNGCGANVRYRPDVAGTEEEFEILLGDTNRAFSAELLEAISAYGSSDEILVWGYAYKDGKLAYTANSDDAFSYGSKEFLALVSEDGTLSVPFDLYVINYITVEDYEEYLRLEEEKAKQEYFDTLLKMYEAFTDDQFNTDKYTPGQFYKPMIDENGGGYFTSTKNGEPWAYPADNQHPRYLISESDVDRLKEIISEGEDAESIYYDLVRLFWSRAKTDMVSIHYGVFQDQYKGSGSVTWIPSTGEPYRYDAMTLSVIEAKALAYLVTGEEIYAYEAIVGIKNAMLSLHYTTDLHQDPYHGASRVMVTLAAVYDWCYDALSETDKWHLIWGTAQILGPQLESGFYYPPTALQGVNGHSTGPQVLRDWMSVATVFYDEVPDWWEYVAGAYFNIYLPVANEQFKNGWVSQGTANYAPLKLYNQLWAAYLVYLATGENYLVESADMTAYFLMSHITPRKTENGYEQFYFATGDGGRGNEGIATHFSDYFLFSALFNDPVIYAQALTITNNHRISSETIAEETTMTMTHAFQLCIAASVDYNGEGMRDGVDTIQYFADPAGSMTIRESWDDPNSIAVLMQLSNKTMSNHESYAHGTFQIYYNGLLATNSGRYSMYGSPHHYYYLQSTISSNGLLVFNPSFASTDSNQPASYFYSGSQLRKQVAGDSVDGWLSTASMAETVGAAYGYDSTGKAKYAYLAGDLTDAYDSRTVEHVGRKMLTLFTGDDDFPALFFTFDQIVSDDENYTKHWLLHTIKEPEIDQGNLTATVINGDGKMYLESLYGADAIVKIGGEGKAFWVNGYFTDPNNKGSWNVKTQDFDDPENIGSWVEGKNVTDEVIKNDHFDRIWGRIELRTTGTNYSKFFTVMAISDTDNETSFEIDKFKSDDDLVYGAHFKNDIIVFLNNEARLEEKQYKEFSFSAEGKGLYNYYITGLETGTWQVLVDGVSVAYAYATEEGSMITFTAPTGEVTLKPGTDVIGANGGKIKYNTGGAILPQDTLYFYKSETDFQLPTEIKRGVDVFLGWYTSPTYEPETAISVIPAGTTGTVTVYAKWISNFLDEDYSITELNNKASHSTANGVTYNGSAKKGSSFITKYDEEREKNYLEWTRGEADPIISQTSSTKNFSMLGSDSKCVSFTFSLMLEPGKTPMSTGARLIAKKNIKGGTISGTATSLFATDEKGNVKTNDGGMLCQLSETEITDIKIVIDFKNGEMRYYDKYNSLIVTDKWSVPATVGTKSHEEFLGCLTEYLWYWRGAPDGVSADANLRVYGIRVQEGDEFTGVEVPQTEGIKYNTLGGTLPSGTLRDFNKDGSATLLPTEVLRDGYVFDGWYTSPTYDEGTKTTESPAGSTGLYEVWAKWNVVFIEEDYSSTDVNIKENYVDLNGLTYNGYGKPKAMYKTESENGKKYLVWTPGEADSLIVAQNADINISTMLEDQVSYTLKLSKNGDANLPDFEFRLIGKHTISGDPISTNSDISFASLINGVFYLGGGTENPLVMITNEVTTIRIVLDFATGMIEAYDDFGRIIGTQAFPSINAASGATNYLEYRQSFRSYLFYTRRINGSADKVTESIRYYGIRIEEGNAFALKDGEEIPKDNSILYELNGGTLPEGAPTEYDPILGTLLPTNPTKSGFVFGGWFRDSDLLGKRIDYIPCGGTEPVRVYAKWLAIVMSKDYENETINVGHNQNTALDGMNYWTLSTTSPLPAGNMFTTVDEDANTYLKIYAQTDSRMTSTNGSGPQLRNLENSAVSFEFDYGRIGTSPLLSDTVRFATSASYYGSYNFLEIDGATGEVKLVGADAPFAVIGSEADSRIKIRLTIDFEAATITAYGDNGEVLDSVALGAVPTSAAGHTQPQTWAEWQRLAYGHFAYNNFSASEAGVDNYAYYDNFKVIDGRPYIKFATELPAPNDIIYELNGGTLPAEAPVKYDKDFGTLLPTDVTKSGSIFVGWYRTKDFSDEPVTSIGLGETSTVTVYAKWLTPDTTIIYVTNGGTLSSDAPDSYDYVSGTTLTSDIVREYYSFEGWYLTEDFSGEPVTAIGEGCYEAITVYAKWKYIGRYNVESDKLYFQ